MRLGAHGMLVLAGQFLVLVVFPLDLVSMITTRWRPNPTRLLLFFGLPVIFVAGAIFISRIFQQRTLIRAGAYSVGRIISCQRRFTGRSRKAEIVYEFPVGGHKPMTGRGIDRTGKPAVDNPVLVFYDANDISRYVALCSTFWRVRTKDGKIFEP